MNYEEIYRKTIEELHHKTYGKLEHDEKKVIELFSKLLDRDIKSHCDTIKKLCLTVGYDECASEKIGKIYDIISLYKDHKKEPVQYWDIDKIINN